MRFPLPGASLLREFSQGLLSVVYPTACWLCGNEPHEIVGSGLCRDCWGTLEPWLGPACEGCGLPMVSMRVADSVAPLCSRCRRGEHDFDWARSFGLYAGNLRRAIIELKFSRRARLGKRLGGLLAKRWMATEVLSTLECPLLVPVPLHPTRERERGFNQAQLLAEGLRTGLTRAGTECAPELAPRCLWRTRATAPQAGLSVAARRENVRGVFEVSMPGLIGGRVTVLLDDVMTTGATLSACAAALKRAGAQRVLALTLARAAPEFPDLAGAGSRMEGIDDLGWERG